MVSLLLLCAALAGPAEVDWQRSDATAVAIVQLDSAPFPHPSRAEGYTTKKGEHFPADPHYADRSVGIVVPAGYRKGEAIDFVVHFHGHRNNVANVLTQFDLPRQLRQSGRNAILVVPQGAKDAPDEACGRLEEENGLRNLLNDVAALLHRERVTDNATIGKVVITAHSGGYWPAACVLARGGLGDRVTDVLLFDATYGGLESFADFAGAAPASSSSSPAPRLVSIFTSHLADRNYILLTLLRSRKIGFDLLMDGQLVPAHLAPRRPIFIHTRDLPHNDVVSKRDYYALFLQTSALEPR